MWGGRSFEGSVGPSSGAPPRQVPSSSPRLIKLFWRGCGGRITEQLAVCCDGCQRLASPTPRNLPTLCPEALEMPVSPASEHWASSARLWAALHWVPVCARQRRAVPSHTLRPIPPDQEGIEAETAQWGPQVPPRPPQLSTLGHGDSWVILQHSQSGSPGPCLLSSPPVPPHSKKDALPEPCSL